MKTSLIVSFVIIALIPTLSNLVFAQNDKPTDEEVQFATLLLETSFKAIKEKAPIKYQKELNSISYKLVKSLDPSIMHAKISDTKNKIEISVGAVNLLANLAYASTASLFIEGGPTKMFDWMRVVAKTIDSKIFIYKDFLTYSGIEQPKQEWFPTILNGKINAGISFVMAHECAHILLGHTAYITKTISSDEIRSIEYKADSLSVDLIAPLADGDGTLYTFYSSGYITLFLFSMVGNMDVLAFETMRDHPPEVKRAVKIAGFFYQKAFRIISNEQYLKIIEDDYNNRILELKFYNQVIQYQNYVYDPNNEVISIEEWQKLKPEDRKK